MSEVLGDPLDLPRWWPSVYLNVEALRPPDARGLGRRVRLLTKGRLPYTIRWESSKSWSRAIRTASRSTLSFLLKPVFEANHRWAMAHGELCLKRELSRRR